MSAGVSTAQAPPIRVHNAFPILRQFLIAVKQWERRPLAQGLWGGSPTRNNPSYVGCPRPVAPSPLSKQRAQFFELSAIRWRKGKITERVPGNGSAGSGRGNGMGENNAGGQAANRGTLRNIEPSGQKQPGPMIARMAIDQSIGRHTGFSRYFPNRVRSRGGTTGLRCGRRGGSRSADRRPGAGIRADLLPHRVSQGQVRRQTPHPRAARRRPVR